MRKHVLFFVHGMGSYVTASGSPSHAWSRAAAKSLKEQYDKYLLLGSIPFDDRFDVVHINYDTVFHKLLKRWDDEASRILASGDAAAPEVQDMLGWLTDSSSGTDNFAWTHASDVVLYWFFSLVRQRIKTHVANQFRNVLAPNSEGAVTSWSVIAHSLGTTVTHDVLHALDSTTPNEAGISILDSMVPSANAVCMIANVSKIMQTDIDVYDESLVVPSSAIRPSTACFNYLSFNNIWDPFVTPDPFDPRGNPSWDVAESNDTFLDVEIENVHEKNVHSIDNYLVNPAVHIPLLERLCGIGSVLDSEKDDAFEQFENVPDETVEAAFDELIARFPEATWLELIGQLYSEWGLKHA
jgi:hypothetical protein